MTICAGTGLLGVLSGFALFILLWREPDTSFWRWVAILSCAATLSFIFEHLRAEIEGHDMLKLEKCPNHVTVSIGVASCPETNPTVDRLIGDAEEAMYAAKTGGRNRVTCAGGSGRVSEPSGIAH